VKIYVGNLSYQTDNDGLRAAFEQFGAVNSAEVIIDRNTNRSRGFGFVEMPTDDEAKAAIAGLDGKDLDGRPVKVNEARPRRSDFGGGSGGGGGGGGSSYRY
jgi:cold-inducible RNA-binding protein